ncbi:MULTISPECIES: hypothetical protein [Psychrobacter]|uniref:hypothetical protein n=1 Tax=Psychrobacter TaxID=497 RepID=UPI00146C26F5|nr:MULTISPECIES: hypothetical protein [Psychrobacter]
MSDTASITLYEFEVKAGAFAMGRHPRAISKRISSDEIAVFALARSGRLVKVEADTLLQFGDIVWYAMRGDYARQIAQIFNDTKLDKHAIEDFYGDWLLSPNVKLGDLPFFADLKKAEAKQLGNPKAPSIWQQTVAEFVMANVATSPVAGDKIVVNEEWSLVVKEVDKNGVPCAIGLKHEALAAIV